MEARETIQRAADSRLLARKRSTIVRMCCHDRYPPLIPIFFFFIMIRPPPRSTLFPSTPLFRSTRRFANIQSVAERKLAQLDAAVTLEFLRSPPGNRLEMLVGDRQGQHSIRINDQWRVCFVWKIGRAHV